MEKLGLHPGLETRLQLLSERIFKLRRQADAADKLKAIDAHIQVEALEKRYQAWEKRLQALNRAGDGFFVRLKAGAAQIAFDATASLQSFGEWLDSEFRAARLSDGSRRSE